MIAVSKWFGSFLTVLLITPWCVTSADEPTGASLAFTSQDPTIVQARELFNQGAFAKAETLLHRDLESQSDTPKRAREELLEIMRRVRYEYSLKPDDLLKKLQAVMPTTRQQMQSWSKESRARTRTIDGELFYFRREPQNIFLFSPAAQQCRADAGKQPAKDGWSLAKHLLQVIEAGENSTTPEVMPAPHRITHTLKIRPGHPAIKPGAVVRVWLPFAQEYRQQRNVKLVRTTPEPKTVAPNAVDGAKVTGGAQRTVYFQQTIEDIKQPLVFTEVIEFTSYAYYPKLDEAASRDATC